MTHLLRDDPPLAGRVALVTGAGRGLGRAIAVAAARAGADVALLDIAGPVEPAALAAASTTADLDTTADLVAAAGRRALALLADVRDPAGMVEAVHRTTQVLGRLDLVAANAGIASTAPLLDMTPDQWRAVIDVNLTGTFNTLSAVAPALVAAGSGRIVATASIAGRRGMPGIAHYVASKWGIIGLVKTAALELGPYGITVNAVAPTLVDTLMIEPADRAAMADGLDDVDEASLGHALPVGSIGPDDVADAVVFLLSDRARYVSGTCLDVSAGASAHYSA